MSDSYELPLFPLNVVLFPGMPLALHIFEPRYKLMIGQCIENKTRFGVVLLKNGSQVGERDVAVNEVGTAASITYVKRLDSGEMDINTLGNRRFQIESVHHRNPYLTGIVHDYPLENSGHEQIKLLSTRISIMVQKYLKIFAMLGNVHLKIDTLPEDPATLAFLTAVILNMPMQEKQKLLDVPELLLLLQAERRILHREAQILKNLIEQGPRWRDDPNPFSPN